MSEVHLGSTADTLIAALLDPCLCSWVPSLLPLVESPAGIPIVRDLPEMQIINALAVAQLCFIIDVATTTRRHHGPEGRACALVVVLA